MFKNFDHGRLLEKTKDKNCFNVLVCNYVFDCTDSERCFQFDDCYIDISDDWINVEAVESYADCNKENEPIQFVLACIDYYGVENFGGTEYYTEEQLKTENEIRDILKCYDIKAEVITQLILAEILL